MLAKVYITLKKGVHDPQGQAVEDTLSKLGYEGVKGVRIGKFVEMELGSDDVEGNKKRVEEMCQKLLANSVIETYKVELS
ncbi:MAG: phosphoribosylformylglycinamidine synthase subunit PurS [Pseudomonadota bacterium]